MRRHVPETEQDGVFRGPGDKPVAGIADSVVRQEAPGCAVPEMRQSAQGFARCGDVPYAPLDQGEVGEALPGRVFHEIEADAVREAPDGDFPGDGKGRKVLPVHQKGEQADKQARYMLVELPHR